MLEQLAFHLLLSAATMAAWSVVRRLRARAAGATWIGRGP